MYLSFSQILVVDIARDSIQPFKQLLKLSLLEIMLFLSLMSISELIENLQQNIRLVVLLILFGLMKVNPFNLTLKRQKEILSIGLKRRQVPPQSTLTVLNLNKKRMIT